MRLDADENILNILGQSISVPEHLLARYNKEYGVEVRRMHFTVPVGTQMSDDEIWDMMVQLKRISENSTPLDFGDYLALEKSNPPKTGVDKRSLLD